MKKIKIIFGISILLFSLLVQAGTNELGSELEITIDVAPSVLNLQNQGQVVTIHTNISYSLVVGTTVLLNDVPIQSWKSDNRGNFVAKFNIEEIKDLPLEINGYNELKMVGETLGGISFVGIQDIKVINKIPSGKK